MSDDSVATVFAGSIVLAVVILLQVWAESASCTSKYSTYGETSYGPIQGCMVKLKKDGRMVPAETIREI